MFTEMQAAIGNIQVKKLKKKMCKRKNLKHIKKNYLILNQYHYEKYIKQQTSSLVYKYIY